jgi:hypothetical protein
MDSHFGTDGDTLNLRKLIPATLLSFMLIAPQSLLAQTQLTVEQDGAVLRSGGLHLKIQLEDVRPGPLMAELLIDDRKVRDIELTRGENTVAIKEVVL